MTDKRRINLISLKPDPMITKIDDRLALDKPLCIFVNGEYLATLIATPTLKKELVVGYLFTEGIIDSMKDIKGTSFVGNDVLIDLNREVDLGKASVGVMNLIITACGSKIRDNSSFMLPRVESDFKVKASKILEMCRELNRRSKVHKVTGGTHSAMLCFGNGEIQAFAEDVGRHNAVDKVIGSMVLEGRELGKCILVSTGRLSGEIIQKAGRGGIPIVASMTVPLDSGVRLAEAVGLTLISLWRGQLKVYVNPQRVQLS